jgi:hypothetical protein
VKNKRQAEPSPRSKHISKVAWWFEDAGGIYVIHQPEPGTATLRITWSELLKAAKRCGRSL